LNSSVPERASLAFVRVASADQAGEKFKNKAANPIRNAATVSTRKNRSIRVLRDSRFGPVVRFQHSHSISTGAFANVGIKGPPEEILFLVEFWI
jgi:hypothetical protein